MIKQIWFECGEIFGMRYFLGKRGDGLAMHKHTRAEDHNVIVLRGSLRISSRRWPGIDVRAPCVINILPEWHELVALEEDTELLNLFKHGKPAEYASMPESEKSVCFETRELENPL